MSSFITTTVTETIETGTTTYISTGSGTAWSGDQLVDTGAAFQTDGVSAGDVVKNTSRFEKTMMSFQNWPSHLSHFCKNSYLHSY